MYRRWIGLFGVIGAVFLHLTAAFTIPEGKSQDYFSLDEVEQIRRYDEFQMKIDELWKRYTRESALPPSFFSPSFNSTIIGKEMETINGRTIYAFQGFRYGQAERFKPTVAVGKFWEGDVFTANHLGFKCPQGAMIGHTIAGDEDCLYINVYTPYLPSKNKKLPVMFFIHGGAFITGDSSMYLPTKLLDHDVILVTIHYRLGTFGFFTLNNHDAPGNPALYDMVEALRWNKKYIEDFGGDKDRVTIFGESAGSVSVNYMMLVSPARDLFHGVIAESGSSLDVWALDEDPQAAAKFIANYVGCPTEDDTLMFECVVKQDMDDLVRAEYNLIGTDRHNGLMGFRGAAPTIQTVQLTADDNYELLVTKRPMEYFRDGDFAKVPFMTGSNKQEGSFVLGIMYGDYLQYNGLTENVTYMREEMIQDILGSYAVVDNTYSISNSMTMKYCPGVDLGDFDAAAPCLIDMVGVLFLKAGSWETCNLHSYYSDKATFYYSFEFEGNDSMYYWIMGIPPFDPGVTHSDELMYIFSMPAVMDMPEEQMTERRMTKLWTNFAIYGNPTPAEEKESLDELGIPTWTPYGFEQHKFLLIQNDVTMQNEYTERWTITMDELKASRRHDTKHFKR